MYTYKHPRAANSVDIVVFRQDSRASGEFQVLLIRRGSDPYQGQYALPGGFVDIDESLENAAKRELIEETGIKINHLIQIQTFSDPDRDPRGRVISTAFAVILDKMVQNIQPGSDATQVEWAILSDLPDLAFDHLQIINTTVEKLGLR